MVEILSILLKLSVNIALAGVVRRTRGAGGQMYS